MWVWNSKDASARWKKYVRTRKRAYPHTPTRIRRQESCMWTFFSRTHLLCVETRASHCSSLSLSLSLSLNRRWRFYFFLFWYVSIFAPLCSSHQRHTTWCVYVCIMHVCVLCVCMALYSCPLLSSNFCEIEDNDKKKKKKSWSKYITETLCSIIHACVCGIIITNIIRSEEEEKLWTFVRYNRK